MRPDERGGDQRGFYKAPRLRALLLAYLRGLLLPNYPHGVTSEVREQMIVLAIMREQDGESLVRRAFSELSLVPLMESGKQNLAIQDAMKRAGQGNALKKMMAPDDVFGPSQENIKVEDVKKMGAGLNLLKSTDYVEKIERLLSKIFIEPPNRSNRKTRK